MIISRTPFRVSFFGGGTDYPSWYRSNGGSVLATTINKYCYLSCRYLPPFFEHTSRIVYSKVEHVRTFDDIEHRAVRAILKHMKVPRGVEIHHDSDLPARSGLGSSSAFTVGLLKCLYALYGQMPTKQKLALESIHIEQEVLQETVGCQDQVLAAYGGFNHITFSPGGDISVEPVTLSSQRIQELTSYLMLIFTGINRTASSIASTYAKSMEENEQQMRSIRGMVDEGLSILSGSDDIRRFGKLLHEYWQTKRSLSASICTNTVEQIYDEALACGADGGKLLGAGGGGFLLLFAEPGAQKRIKDKFRNLIHVPFKFETYGSQIILADLEEDSSHTLSFEQAIV